MTDSAITKSRGPSLWEIEDGLQEIWAEIAEAEANCDLVDQSYIDALEAYTSGAVVKRDRVAQFILHVEHVESQFDEEIARLMTKREQIKRTRERMEGYVLAIMERIGVTKLDGQLHTLKAKKNPPHVEIESELMLPAEYLVPVPQPPPRPDKAAIKRDLQAGKDVSGAKLENDTRLEVE